MMTHQPIIPANRIMVVEEDPNSFIASILRLTGYDVTHIQSGAVALTQILNYPPSLIISKVLTIPEGEKAFSEYLRETPQIPYIPILLVASPGSGDLIQCLDFGADDFLRYPVETDELLARVRSLLRLKNTFDERERSTQMREDFLSRLTHDLRTPLVAADRMYTRLCQNKYGPLTDEARQILASMQDNNQELLTLTNTLLSIYRYESGSKSLSFTEFDLLPLIESVLNELQPIADEKMISLIFHLQVSSTFQKEAIATKVEAVKLELRNALINLISNALNYTDQGSIQVTLNSTTRGYNLIIQDTGIGIKAEDLPHIFDRFYQGQSHRSGSGLGLNLVQKIISAHHGTIKATSPPNQGTCFSVWLPRYQPQESTSTKS